MCTRNFFKIPCIIISQWKVRKRKIWVRNFLLFFFFNFICRASQVAQVVKNPPATAGDMRCRFDPWVRNILAWRIPWIKKPGRLQLTGLQRVGHNLAFQMQCYLEKQKGSTILTMFRVRVRVKQKLNKFLFKIYCQGVSIKTQKLKKNK